VNRIADVAGVSVGSLYQYFPTKEALFAGVLKRHSSEMIDAFGRDLGDIGLLDVPLAARRVIASALAAYAIEPELLRVIVEQVPHVGVLARSAEFEEQIAFLLRAYLEHHKSATRPLNLDVAVPLLVTTVQAVATRFVLSSAKVAERDELVDELTTLVLRYVER